VGGDRVWIGLGAWLFGSEPQRARAQLEMARGLAAAGISLFSYDAIAETPALAAELAPQPPALPPPAPAAAPSPAEPAP
jgi:hypothetical protein